LTPAISHAASRFRPSRTSTLGVEHDRLQKPTLLSKAA
jgi:hypothetical protein